MNTNAIPGPSRRVNFQEPDANPAKSPAVPFHQRNPPPETPVSTPSLKFYQSPGNMASARRRVVQQMSQQVSRLFKSCVFSPSTADESESSAPAKARKSSSQAGKRTGKAPANPSPKRDYRRTMAFGANKVRNGKEKEPVEAIRTRLDELGSNESRLNNRSSLVEPPDQNQPSAMTVNNAESSSIPRRPHSGIDRFMRLLGRVQPRPESHSPEQPPSSGDFRLRTQGTSAKLNAATAAIRQDFWPNLLNATLNQLKSATEQLETINDYLKDLDSNYENLASMVGSQNDRTSGPMRNMMTGLQGLAGAYDEGPINEGGMPPSGMRDLSERAAQLLDMEIQPARDGQDALRFGQLGTTHTYDETHSQKTPGPRLFRTLSPEVKMNFKVAFASLRDLRDDLEQLIATLQTATSEPAQGATSDIANVGAEGEEGMIRTGTTPRDGNLTSSDLLDVDNPKGKAREQQAPAPVRTEAAPDSQGREPAPSVRSVYVRENSPELTQAGLEDLAAALAMYAEYQHLGDTASKQSEGSEHKRVE